jgi:hypothetical protein
VLQRVLHPPPCARNCMSELRHERGSSSFTMTGRCGRGAMSACAWLGAQL